MKTSFNSIYLPVKAGITGDILRHEESNKDGLIKSVLVSYEPNKPTGPWAIKAVFQYKGQAVALRFKSTRKEIRLLVADINDFELDPHLFLNQ